MCVWARGGGEAVHVCVCVGGGAIPCGEGEKQYVCGGHSLW